MTGSLISYCDSDETCTGRVANSWLSASAALWNGNTGALWDTKKVIHHK